MARFVEPMLLEGAAQPAAARAADLAALARLGLRLLRKRPAELGELARMFTARRARSWRTGSSRTS